MKFIKWKSLIITVIICILSVIPGLILWNDLPDSMAVHFNWNNEPDNFTSKGIAVLGFPLLMAGLQLVCCVIHDISFEKTGKKPENAPKWVIPAISHIIQITMLAYNLGKITDIRTIAILIVAGMLIFSGYFMRRKQD